MQPARINSVNYFQAVMLEWRAESSSESRSRVAKFVVVCKVMLGLFQQNGLILGWPKNTLSFFHKIKDTFSIFTNNFIDLDILSLSALSRYWLLLGRGQGCC